ncbi:hypothetical protein HZB06_01600 [Candidatus Wolfebacteria bacterium]|nr:hypothetical protein [Candidatus Wolfebacteria bacterium]
MSATRIVVMGGVIAALILLLAWWLAGASGILFGLMISMVMAVRMGGYLGLFTVPPIVWKLTNWVAAIGVASISIIWISGAVEKQLQEYQAGKTPSAQVIISRQIYPNYDFPDGVNQIKVPLIPANQRLTREAGGWVITPAGSGYRIDYDMDVVIEYNDGRKVARQPGKPAHDGVRPANGIFRIYGEEGHATVIIQRGVY